MYIINYCTRLTLILVKIELEFGYFIDRLRLKQYKKIPSSLVITIDFIKETFLNFEFLNSVQCQCFPK